MTRSILLTLVLATACNDTETLTVSVGGSSDDTGMADTGAVSDDSASVEGSDNDTGVEPIDTGDSGEEDDTGEEIVDTADSGSDEVEDEESETESAYDNDGDGFCEEVACYDDAIPGDCDDDRDDVSPASDEECDGIDNDCDGDVDEGTACASSTEPEPTDTGVIVDTGTIDTGSLDTGDTAFFDTGVVADSGAIDTGDSAEVMDTAVVDTGEEIVDTASEDTDSAESAVTVDEDGDGYVEICWKFPDGFYGGELNLWGSGAYTVIVQVPYSTTVITEMCGTSPWTIKSGDAEIIQGYYYTSSTSSSYSYIARNVGESSVEDVYDFAVFGSLTFDTVAPSVWEAVSYDIDGDGVTTGIGDGAYAYTVVSK